MASLNCFNSKKKKEPLTEDQLEEQAKPLKDRIIKEAGLPGLKYLEVKADWKLKETEVMERMLEEMKPFEDKLKEIKARYTKEFDLISANCQQEVSKLPLLPKKMGQLEKINELLDQYQHGPKSLILEDARKEIVDFPAKIKSFRQKKEISAFVVGPGAVDSGNKEEEKKKVTEGGDDDPTDGEKGPQSKDVESGVGQGKSDKPDTADTDEAEARPEVQLLFKKTSSSTIELQ